MVKIRLTRIGKTHTPFYRIVVADERRARDGKNIEIIGRYQPAMKDNQVEVKKDRAMYWLHQGAQPTETVRALFSKEGLMKQHDDEKLANRRANAKNKKAK
ncbi:30S ribosomal protein S16 [Candidatus Sumerlaeota bacterium]|nr:30S ribosomal protein S16 [Candidatus Sumerlaeota bacterium]